MKLSLPPVSVISTGSSPGLGSGSSAPLDCV